MQLKEYQDAIRPLMYKGEQMIPLSVCALGLGGELGELIEKANLPWNSWGDTESDFCKEVGDVLWYIMAIDESLQLRLADASVPPVLPACGASDSLMLLPVVVGGVLDDVKKAQWHNKPISAPLMSRRLGYVLMLLSRVCKERSLTLAQVAQANVDKLRARWPDGFKPAGGTK